MDILKEISKDKLIVMVTHNPELAEQYSTRIIRMLDGELKADSMPLSEEDIKKEKELEKASANEVIKRPTMSLATSVGLSARNLISKKARTVLISFAGSIGIIGIALIFAVSQGMTTYIDSVQEDTLSTYPVTIESTSVDIGTLMSTFMGGSSSGEEHEKDAVYTKPVVYDMVDSFSNLETTENDLKSFKAFMEAEMEKEAAEGELNLGEAISGIQYTYDMDLQVFTKNVDGNIITSDTEKLLTDLMTEYIGMDMSMMTDVGDSSQMASMSSMASMSPMSSMGGMSMNLWQEMLPGEDGKMVSPLLEEQYEVVYGSWPTAYDEIILVLDENNELDDLTLYALGLESEAFMDAIMEAATDKTELDLEHKTWTYEEICDMEFRTVLSADCYSYDQNTGLYTDLRDTDAGLKYIYDNGIPLKVSGIIRPNEDATATMLSGSIGYTKELTEYLIEHAKDAAPVKAQLDSPSVDIFTNLPFAENTGKLSDEEKEKAFHNYLENLSEDGKANAYVEIKSIPTEEQLDGAVQQAMAGMDRAAVEGMMSQGMAEQVGMSEEEIAGYLTSMSDEDIMEAFEMMVQEQVKLQIAAQVQQQMAVMPKEQLAMALDAEAAAYTAEQCALYYDEVLEFSESTYEDNLSKLGYVDLDDPATINIYASTFENKDVIADAIELYNEDVDEISQIKYTDYAALMMSSVTTIINAITYVLIAFVGISLVVSSIMIAVITLISVQERTKEIGILRAMGASKKDVSRMFYAETVIIGFVSGTLGVVITYLLCIPINAVIHSVTGLTGLSAHLPIGVAIIFVIISEVLNLISGLVPAKSAAKKDPVVALRSE